MKPLIMIFSVLLLTGCNRYFKPVNTNASTKEIISNFIDSNRIFIVHDFSYDYELQNPKFNEEGTAITGDLKKIRGFHESRVGKNKIYYRYKSWKPDSVITRQVHLFTSLKLMTTPGVSTNIPLEVINRTETLQFDKKKTNRTKVAVGVGILMGVGLAIATATAAAMSSFSLGIAPM